MKVAAYHNSNNGVSHYRVWQPMKYLARHGYTVKRLPDNTACAWIPLTGKGGNIPGWESHEAVTKWSDVIFTNFRQHREETGRIVAQAQLRPLVLDLDDDMTNIDRSNGAWDSWQAHPERNHAAEVPDDAKMEDLARLQKEGFAIVTVKGKRYIVRDEGRAGWENVIDQVKAAALVTVATDHLKTIYGRYNPNTVVIPNAIDFEVWKRTEPSDDGLVRIGLFGSNSHYKDWAVAAPAIKRILDEFPKVRLLFNGWLVMEESDPTKPFYQKARRFRFPDYFESLGLLENPQVEIHEPCEIQDYPRWLMGKRVDIGLAPLDCGMVFNKAKSNLKYIEFSAMGVPGVYAEAEPYKCVVDGVTGLKAKSTEDYYRAMKRLVTDADLRKRLGDAAHADVRENYDQDKVSVKLAGEIREIVKQRALVAA